MDDLYMSSDHTCHFWAAVEERRTWFCHLFYTLHLVAGKIKKNHWCLKEEFLFPFIPTFFLPSFLPLFLPFFLPLSLLFPFFFPSFFFPFFLRFLSSPLQISVSNLILEHELWINVMTDVYSQCGLRREEGFLIRCLWRPWPIKVIFHLSFSIFERESSY